MESSDAIEPASEALRLCDDIIESKRDELESCSEIDSSCSFNSSSSSSEISHYIISFSTSWFTNWLHFTFFYFSIIYGYISFVVSTSLSILFKFLRISSRTSTKYRIWSEDISLYRVLSVVILLRIIWVSFFLFSMFSYINLIFCLSHNSWRFYGFEYLRLPLLERFSSLKLIMTF